jgi:ComF family protein
MPEIMQAFEQASDEARVTTGLHAYSTPSPKRSSPFNDLRQIGTRLGSAVLDLIFPPSCAGCGRVDSAWCNRCDTLLRNIPIETLRQTLPMDDGELEVVSTGWHTELLQTSVQALKYENLPMLAQPLGTRLASVLGKLDWHVGLIIPVPMHASRLRTRGYNQAALLAEALGDSVGVLVEPDALQRVRDTRSQVGLSRAERLDNMAEAFLADQRLVRDHTILLIDDVATTGATLRGCAESLYTAGAAKVYGMTVSAALGNLDLPANKANEPADDLSLGDRYTFDNRDLSIR